MSTRSSGSTVAGSALKPWGYLWRKQKPHRELWRPVPRRRTDLHRLRRVCDQPNRGQALRQTSIDALDTSGCTPASSDPNTRPQQRPRSSHPSLLPRLQEITGHRHCPRFVMGPYICRSRSAFLTSRTWLPNGGCGVLRDVPLLDEPLRTADRRATAEGPRQAPRKLASCRSLPENDGPRFRARLEIQTASFFRAILRIRRKARANWSHASEDSIVASKSFDRRRARLIQPRVLSTTHLLGKTMKPLTVVSVRLTTVMVIRLAS